VDGKAAPQNEPKPPLHPVQSERGQASRDHQDEQNCFPEYVGRVRQQTRGAGDIETGEDAEIEKKRQAAAQRGRVN